MKQQRQLTILANPKIVFSYRSSCFDLPVVLVDCQVEGCASRLHHVCQGGYVDMHEINLDGAERNICRDCVDELQMESKPGTHHCVQDGKMEDDKEEVEGTVLGDGGEGVIIVPVVYPRGTVSVSSLGSVLSVDSSSKPDHPSLLVSVRVRHIQEYFSNKRGGEQNSLSHIRRRPGMRRG